MSKKNDSMNNVAIALLITAATFTTVFIGAIAAISIFLYKQYEKLRELPLRRKTDDSFESYDLSYDDDDDSWKVDAFDIDDEDIPF